MMDFKQRQKRQKGQEKKKLLFWGFFLFLNLFILLYVPLTVRANDSVAGNRVELTNAERIHELDWMENEIDQTELAESEPEQTESEMKQPEVKLYALSAVLLDATNNRILYEKNADQIMPMASTTKIMTAIIALESGNMDDVVTVSKKAASMPNM